MMYYLSLVVFLFFSIIIIIFRKVSNTYQEKANAYPPVILESTPINTNHTNNVKVNGIQMVTIPNKDVFPELSQIEYNEMVNEVNIQYDNSDNMKIWTLRELVPKRQKNGTVMVTFTDFGYIDEFYLSTILSKLDRFSNYIVVAIEIGAYKELYKKGYPVAFFNVTALSGTDTTTAALFGSKVFKYKMNAKQRIIREVLLLNCSILLFDSDVLLLKDPLPLILSYKEYDLISQKDERICAGFIFYRPTLTSIHFLNHVIHFMPIWGISDQPTTNRLIDENTVPTLQWKLLPEELYSSGLVFFDKHQFKWDSIQEQQITIHNNFIMGAWNKIYRLKEMGLYLFDKDGEYSNSNATYLVIEESKRTHLRLFSEIGGNENRTLEIGVQLSNIFNRSFVVPILPCGNKTHLSKCNLCGNQFRFCHHDIMRKAIRPWKEHIFFTNPNVPQTIRDAANTAPCIEFRTKKNPCSKQGGANKKITCLQLEKENVSVLDVAKVLSKYEQYPVIRIHSFDSLDSLVY